MTKKKNDTFVDEIEEVVDELNLSDAQKEDLIEDIIEEIEEAEDEAANPIEEGFYYRTMLKVDRVEVPVYKVPFTKKGNEPHKFNITKDHKMQSIATYVGILIRRYARDLSNDELKFIAKYRA